MIYYLQISLTMKSAIEQNTEKFYFHSLFVHLNIPRYRRRSKSSTWYTFRISPERNKTNETKPPRPPQCSIDLTMHFAVFFTSIQRSINYYWSMNWRRESIIRRHKKVKSIKNVAKLGLKFIEYFD